MILIIIFKYAIFFYYSFISTILNIYFFYSYYDATKFSLRKLIFEKINRYNKIGDEGASKLGSGISHLKDLTNLSLNLK